MAMKPRTALFAGVVGAAVIGIGATIVVNASGGAADDQNTVTWWVPDWDYQEAVKIVETFEADNPDIKVELVQTTGDTVANRTAVALDSGNTPDVITESIARIRGYADKDQLADLSTLYGQDLPEDDFAPGLIDALTVDGATYAVPYRWATNALIYNPALFQAAGIDEPPATWAEFEEDAKKLTQGNVVGTAWPMQGDASDLTLRFLDFALSDGATIENGLPKLTEKSSAGAINLIGDAINEGWASKSSFELDNTGIRELFLQGRVAMYPAGVFDVDAALEAGAPIATAALPGPDGPGTAQGVGWAYIVPQASQKKDAAQKLVSFLGQPENMAALTLTFPARVSASDDPKFTTPERAAYAEQLAEHSVPAPNDPRWTAVLQQVHDEIQKVALGDKSAAAAATSIQEIADKTASN
ncbi:ABC transporter substrate-binding protein [Kineosporia babensis]|uniref:Sugar ABC transporter substrate-binding protein n=1 Tax=Kineosporia babensis TaxID=499548 RepID=A0A9X1NJ69_9ACTN|nr:sugar ABC transporter substrate-binding protein [Kineosporia babensis]MCD5314088.1 sugar ABC transporter substrate-binding protein [Kineosporia babensis]